MPDPERYTQLRMPNRPRVAPALNDEYLLLNDLIIKNIPYTCSKEQFLLIMEIKDLPLPYTFNYHFPEGVFRGVAFANFLGPVKASQVINAMNGLPIMGREVRVEYKKRLPAGQQKNRARQEQLQEYHQRIGTRVQETPLSMKSITPSGHRMCEPHPLLEFMHR
jgi:RNA recognition motif-containing protein